MEEKRMVTGLLHDNLFLLLQFLELRYRRVVLTGEVSSVLDGPKNARQGHRCCLSRRLRLLPHVPEFAIVIPLSAASANHPLSFHRG